MRAELLKIDWYEELREFHRKRSISRAPGRHLSDIVSRIVKQTEPGRFGDGPIDPALAHQGFVWEDALSLVFARQFGFARQIEAELDGITGTLDGFRLRDLDGSRCRRVVEFKMSKMSAANLIESKKFEPWHIRTMGYCQMMDCDEAEIVVLFINGSYELGGGRFGATIPKGWRIRYSKTERRENWDWILRTRDEMDEEGKGA